MSLHKLFGSAGGAGGLYGVQQAQLTSPAPVNNGNFGRAVSLSADGSTLVVGADKEGSGGLGDAGVAYVFIRSGASWSLQATLTAADAYFGDRFGTSASISADGNTVVIGAVQSQNASFTRVGATYVFVRSGSSWSQQAKLLVAESTIYDKFGATVSISDDGNTLISGLWATDIDSPNPAGAAYVFVRSGSSWSQQAKLTGSDAAAGAQFNYVSINADGNTAVVGAMGVSSMRGAAYVFVRSGSSWSQQAKLTASDAANGAAFGPPALSADGNTAVIGATGDNEFRGAAYVFVRSGSSWSQQAKLTASDAATDSFFGVPAISADGNTAVVSASSVSSVFGSFSGEAYIFTRSNDIWSEQIKLSASNPAQGDNFGVPPTISGDGETAAFGAIYKTASGVVSSGAVYIFI